MNFRKALGISLGVLAGAGTGYMIYKVCTAPQPNMGRPGNSGNGNNTTPAGNNTNSAADILEERMGETSKGEVFRQSLRSAANVCSVASMTAQCVSGIADNVSRMSAIFSNPASLAANPGGIYPGQQPYYGRNFVVGNGWNRLNPFIVSTGSGIEVTGPTNYPF